MIVITAPTGQIGDQLLENVLDRNEWVRVIVRDPVRLTPHVRNRVEVVLGSYSNLDVLTVAAAEADACF